MKRIVAGLGSALLALGVVTVAPPADAASQKLLVAVDGQWFGVGDTKAEAKGACVALDSEIDSGTSVKVKNESGKVVGAGTLDWYVTSVHESGDDTWPYESDCLLTAKFPVGSAKYYEVEIGGKEAVTYSLAKMKKNKWRVFLTYA